MSALAVVTTGGTIASVDDGRGAAAAQLAGRALVDELGLGEVDVVEICRANGWNVTPADIEEVVRAVGALVGAGAAGVVITHGTDTLEDTAFVLDLFCGEITDRVPVVVTGAIRAADELGTDGRRNLRDAIEVAGRADARGRGVLVVVHDELHAARHVTKAATVGFRPFVSPGGPVGHMVDGDVRWWGAPGPSSRPPIGPLDLGADVRTLITGPGDDGRAVDWAVSAGMAGIVLVGTGAGNVPGPCEAALGRAVAAGVAVVVTSRCGGPTAPVYGGPGGGARLRDLGVVDGRGLPPGKANLALRAALAWTAAEANEVAAWFASL